MECCAANLLWRCGDTVFTPRLERAGVSGIMRGAIMAYLASCGQTCLEVDATRAALDEADEILLCNALLPVVPVRIYRQRELHDFTLCRQLQRFWTIVCDEENRPCWPDSCRAGSCSGLFVVFSDPRFC
ncbi:aminotransferase class IV [Plesiomonas shigelloides subsp. oncorhynchi]|nr:aminotransferase class IV [Plesiomonas shigelloides]